MMLVTLEEASNHLRRDTDFDDTDLVGKILAASARCVDYITTAGMKRFQNDAGAYIAPWVNDDGSFRAPYPVKAAVLLMIGYLNVNRDSDPKSEFDGGELPRPVRALLKNYRIPVLS